VGVRFDVVAMFSTTSSVIVLEMRSISNLAYMSLLSFRQTSVSVESVHVVDALMSDGRALELVRCHGLKPAHEVRWLKPRGARS
jgi:hypothetical protein